MSIAHEATARPRTVAPPTIREHRIPTAGSKPYIAVEGRDGCLWFCESGASKIGRLDPNAYTFKEFDLPTANATPIGIVVGPDGASLVRREDRRQDRPHHAAGPDHRIPAADAERRSRRHAARPGRQHLVLRNRSEPDRPHHAGRQGHRVQGRHHARLASRSPSWCATARCGSARRPAPASAA